MERKTNDLWGVVALEVNHLLLLIGETIRFGGVPLKGFGLLVRTSFIALPLVVGITLYQKEVVPFEKEFAEEISTVYRIGIVVISLAALALGSPGFAIGTLSMFIINICLDKELNQALFAPIYASAAFLAAIGYTAQAFAASGTVALMAKISSVATWGLFCLQDPLRFYLHDELGDWEKRSCALVTDYRSSPSFYTHHDYYRPSIYNLKMPVHNVRKGLAALSRPYIW